MNWMDNLVFLISCMIEIFLIYDFFNHFFFLKIEKRHAVWAYIGASLSLFAINLLEKASLNLILAPLIIWVFLTITFEAKVALRVGYFLIAYGILLGGEFLGMVITNTTAELLEKIGVMPVAEVVWYILFIRLINHITFLFIKQLLDKSQRKTDDKIILIYYCVPLSTMGIMVTIFYAGINFEGNAFLKVSMTVFFILMVLGNILLIYAFEKYVEKMNENVQQQIELVHQKAEVKRLNKINELNNNHNQLVHDTAHYLKAIGQLAAEKKDEEILEVVQNLCGKLYQGEVAVFCENKILNTVLSEYEDRADNNRIEFKAYVEPGCNLKRIKDMDLIVIAGNLLDNAFTAAVKEKDAVVEIKVFTENRGKFEIIKIANSFTGELREDAEGLLTTKREKGIHGIGTKSVMRVIESYGGSFQYYVENKKFYAICVFPI